MESDQELNCQCDCGAARFTLNKVPQVRFYCHCEICQEVYGKPYSDATVVSAGQVSIEDETRISYKSYWSSLQRGLCTECHQPTISFLTLLPFVKVAIIPAAVIDKTCSLPEARAHIFYHRSVNPLNDGIEKVGGFIRSEIKGAALILRGYLS